MHIPVGFMMDLVIQYLSVHEYLTQVEFFVCDLFGIYIIHTRSIDITTIVLQEGWPDKHESSVGFKLDENQCRWCPETGNKCPLDHRMSPVNLVRDRAIEDNKNWKECPDWHWCVSIR